MKVVTRHEGYVTYKCLKCGLLAMTHLEVCPVCGQRMEKKHLCIPDAVMEDI